MSEIDIKKSNGDNDNTSNNEFSTEQVNDFFMIHGYKIIFPDSWDTYNKARVMVYINEELNYKVWELNEDEKHVQSIVIEVGIGRSKRHICNFYYREWKSCVTALNDFTAQSNYLHIMMNIWRCWN